MIGVTCQPGGPSLLLTFLLLVSRPRMALFIAAKEVTSQVLSAEGLDVDLPCDVSPPKAGEKISMVLWFKDDEGVPLYSFDNRNGALELAEHGAVPPRRTSPGRYFFLMSASGYPLPPSGPRADYHNRDDAETPLPPSMARLRILNATRDDSGVFRCRVDFVDSPTRNSKVVLKLAVPPAPPVIIDDHGKEITEKFVGPILEGSQLQLSCSVSGGSPRPSVTWWLGDVVVDTHSESQTPVETVNRLTLTAVGREMLAAKLQCRAQPFPGAAPLVATVQLEIYLKPQRVRISGVGGPGDAPFAAGRSRQLKCESTGSVPAAKLSWAIAGVPINDSFMVSDVHNVTVSTVTIHLRAEDDGKELSCRAVNPKFPNGVLEDRRRLNVVYAPIVNISSEEETSLEGIKEGESVILKCDIASNPPPDRIIWYHGNTALKSQSGDAVPRDQRGVVLKVGPLTPTSGGEYWCAASNAEGLGRSEPLHLIVNYAPRCRGGLVAQRIRATAGEPVKMSCDVLASPAGEGDISFSWTLNRTREVVAIGRGKHLTYAPRNDDDFGFISCQARNLVGTQRAPCLFHIVPPEPPEAPICSVQSGFSPADLVLRCILGSDGGLPQHLVVEIFSEETDAVNRIGTDDDESQTQKVSKSAWASASASPPPQPPSDPPIKTLVSTDGSFALAGVLEPGRPHMLVVHAENSAGRSRDSVRVAGIRIPEGSLTNEPYDDFDNSPSAAKHDQWWSGSSSGHDGLVRGGGYGASLGPASPTASLYGVLLGAASFLVAAITVVAVLVVCRRRGSDRRRDEVERRERARLREAVVVGSLQRQPPPPGEEDAYGMLVTSTSAHGSVMGVTATLPLREGGARCLLRRSGADLPPVVADARCSRVDEAPNPHQHIPSALPTGTSTPPLAIVVPAIGIGRPPGIVNDLRPDAAATTADGGTVVSRADLVLKPLNTMRGT